MKLLTRLRESLRSAGGLTPSTQAAFDSSGKSLAELPCKPGGSMLEDYENIGVGTVMPQDVADFNFRDSCRKEPREKREKFLHIPCP